MSRAPFQFSLASSLLALTVLALPLVFAGYVYRKQKNRTLPALAPVSGTITWHGTPLDGWTVEFVDNDAPNQFDFELAGKRD